jgi:hypothetical protein
LATLYNNLESHAQRRPTAVRQNRPARQRRPRKRSPDPRRGVPQSRLRLPAVQDGRIAGLPHAHRRPALGGHRHQPDQGNHRQEGRRRHLGSALTPRNAVVVFLLSQSVGHLYNCPCGVGRSPSLYGRLESPRLNGVYSMHSSASTEALNCANVAWYAQVADCHQH